MFDEETPDDARFGDARFENEPFGGDAQAADAPFDRAGSGQYAAAGPGSDPLAGPALGPDRIPPRPGVSLIDAGLGAGYLVSRIAVGPARTAARAGRRLAPPARRALHAPAVHGLTDLSEWVLRTLAQVGAPQRTQAEHRIRAAARTATGTIAANRDVSRLVHGIASRQLSPLIDEAVPIVLGRLEEEPEQVREIVRGQSRGMMAEARDTARTGARRGDDVIESVVDKLLRRRTPAAPATPPQAAPVHTAPAPTGPAQPRGPGR